MSRMNAQKYLAQAIHAYGLTHVFMVPTSFVAASAELDRLGVRTIMTHGEKAAVYMADGYARIRRAPGLVHAQNIGAANLAAGLRDPFMAGSPVIALTGAPHPSTTYRNLYQEIEDFPLFKQVTKFAAQLHLPERLPDLLRQLFREATSGAPAPVYLAVSGALGQAIDAEIELPEGNVVAEPVFAAVPATRPRAGDDEIRAALTELAGAARPVIVAGGGVVRSGAQAGLAALAELLRIPVATSMNAKGTIDERHELAVGVVGSYSRASANRAVMAADVVFFVGSHTGSQVTDNWRLPAPGTTVVQLDIDPSELGRNYPNAVSLCGDARATLERMRQIAGEEPATHAAWALETAGFVAEWRSAQRKRLESDAVPMRPERICAEINAALPEDGIVVSDTGHSGIWTASLFDLKPPQTYLRCAGSLGWALPAAIGAQCGAPQRRVVCFTGDGGFYYHLAELETAARYGIPVVIVVNDNRSLSQDLKPYRRAYDGNPTAHGDKMWMFEEVNLAATARSLGCEGHRVETPSELASALKAAIASSRPTVIDAVSQIDAFPDPPFGGTTFYASDDES